MSELIHFDAQIAPGTVREREGQKVRYVDAAEYCTRQLAYVSNVTVVFLNLGPSCPLPLEERLRVDEAVADAYWNTYEGFLLPPRVLRAIRSAAEEAHGDAFLQFAEQARRAILRQEITFEEAAQQQVQHRVLALRLGAEGTLGDYQVAVGEAFCDLLLLQRASMQDMIRAEEERGSNEPRADVLCRMEKQAELTFERALPMIIQTARVIQAIPEELKPALAKFAERRRPFFKSGIFINP